MLVQCVAMYGTWAIYEIPFYVSPWQATPGKRFCGLAVTNLNGQRLTIAHAIGRYLAKILSGAIVIGIFFIAGTRRRQALHDLMARTLVPRRDTLARLQRT
jgi:uncharacterized RDD family membrane protein YckC